VLLRRPQPAHATQIALTVLTRAQAFAPKLALLKQPLLHFIAPAGTTFR
jgi:hypothetical protein